MDRITRRQALGTLGAIALGVAFPAAAIGPGRVQSWPLKASRRTGIHVVAPAPDGGVWFSAQASGHLGHFDPAKGTTELVDLLGNSSPHGVIQGPDKAAWLTDGGAQAIVRVGWPDRAVKAYPLPEGTPYANLNTCAFDGDGDLWFTGQSGVIGKVAGKSGKVEVWDAPRGRGPYGICATPAGEVWYCSLAGSFIARIDRRTGASIVFEPPTRRNGARQHETSIPAATSTSTSQAITASPLAAYAFPTSIDPGSRYLFYLHGRIIEEQGLTAIDPIYGAYQYEAILERLASTGLIVISEQREKDTNPSTYAQRVKAQVESLQRAGVPSQNITLPGASKGAYIAALSAYILEDPALNVVLLGSCDPGMIKEWRSSGRRLYGKVLAIYDFQDDEYSGSCAELFELSAGKGL